MIATNPNDIASALMAMPRTEKTHDDDDNGDDDDDDGADDTMIHKNRPSLGLG
jgi:hypothetical protein